MTDSRRQARLRPTPMLEAEKKTGGSIQAMISDYERQGIARKAIEEFVQYSCAILSPGTEGGAATENGSGIIIRTRGENYCILTAKHIAKEAEINQYRVGLYHVPDLILDFVAGIKLFPDEDVDVGLLIVKDELISPFKGLAVTQDVVPINGQGEIMKGDSLILNGYPIKATRFNPEESLQSFKLLTYWCVPENVSFDKHERYRLEWKDAVERNSDSFDLPDPGGMSGGPLWRFRMPESSSIWAAAEIGRIAAIQSAWDQTETLFLEPVEKWGSWFHESLALIDKWCEEKNVEKP